MLSSLHNLVLSTELIMEIGHPEKFLALDGNRSSRPRVISPEVMSPETWVMLHEILVMSPERIKVKSPEETITKKIRISDC